MSWIDWLLGIDRGATQAAETSVALKQAPALWVIVLVIVPAVLAGAWVLYRREAGAPAPRARAVLAAVRAALLLWILLLLAEPVLLIERSLDRKSHVAVLVDQSLSMGIRDKILEKDERLAVARAVGLHDGPGGLTDAENALLDQSSRIDLVNRVLENPSLRVLDALRERHEVRLYGFDSRLAPDVKPGAFEAKGPLTAVGDAVKYAINDLRGQVLAAIVLFTDGRSNTGDDPGVAARIAADRRIPLFTVAPGVPQVLRDIELAHLEAPEVVIARDAVTLAFRVKTTGFEDQPLTVEILEKDADGERVAASQNLTVDAKTPELPVVMRYKPQKPGELQLVIQTNPVPLPGELTGENNRLTHSLKVVDQKVKVLFVDGYPRWDYRYLKTALVRDDTTVVDVLLVSSDDDFPQEGTKGRTPLTAFPGERKALFDYDVVILGDVRPEDLLSEAVPHRDEVLKNLLAFVDESGGGLCFQAGTRHNPLAFRDTPLAPLLPVEPEDGPLEAAPGSEEFRLQLTPEGRDHPILRMETDPALNRKLLEDPREGLPGFFWFAAVKRAKPGATVLAAHPSADHERYGKRPIVAAQPYGRGRTLFVGLDETYRWRYILGDLYFYRFWRQGISWLRQGRLMGNKRFLLELDRPQVSLGDRVRITVRAFDLDYRPLEEPSIEVKIEPPHGDPERVRLNAVPGKAGQFEGAYLPREPRDPKDPGKTGLHRVTAGPEDPEEEGRAQSQFVCVVPNREFDNPTIDLKTLDAMAAMTEGRFFPLQKVGELPELVRTASAPVATDAREEDLGDAPLAVLLFALLITVEWVWRKVLRMI
jgi:hypothetical protein